MKRVLSTHAFQRPIRRMDGTLILVSSTMSGENRSQMSAYSMEGELLGEWTVFVFEKSLLTWKFLR